MLFWTPSLGLLSCSAENCWGGAGLPFAHANKHFSHLFSIFPLGELDWHNDTDRSAPMILAGIRLLPASDCCATIVAFSQECQQRSCGQGAVGALAGALRALQRPDRQRGGLHLPRVRSSIERLSVALSVVRGFGSGSLATSQVSRARSLSPLLGSRGFERSNLWSRAGWR